jgi:hypothetical protein
MVIRSRELVAPPTGRFTSCRPIWIWGWEIAAADLGFL